MTNFAILKRKKKGQDTCNMKYTILIILGVQFRAINDICAAGWLSHHLFTATSKSSCLLPHATALTTSA